jgi:hypothetical protein
MRDGDERTAPPKLLEKRALDSVYREQRTVDHKRDLIDAEAEHKTKTRELAPDCIFSWSKFRRRHL